MESSSTKVEFVPTYQRDASDSWSTAESGRCCRQTDHRLTSLDLKPPGGYPLGRRHQVTPDQQVFAWAWVLQHHHLIQGISRTHSRGTGISPEDHQQDLLVRLVDKWESYDPDRSSPSTWVWFQSLAIRKGHTTKRRKDTRSVSMEDAHHPTVGPNQFASALVSQIKGQATPQEWMASVAVAVGHTGSSLGEVCECAPYSAQRRVVRLRNRLEGR